MTGGEIGRPPAPDSETEEANNLVGTGLMNRSVRHRQYIGEKKWPRRVSYYNSPAQLFVLRPDGQGIGHIHHERPAVCIGRLGMPINNVRAR